MRIWAHALLAAILALAVVTSTAPAYQPPSGWTTISLADGALD